MKFNLKITIISGGTAPSLKLLKEEVESSNILICADSGGNCLYKYHLIPDYLMGDFDSIDENVLQYFKNSGVVIEKYPAKKNFTDTELVFNKALELKADEIVFLGCTGSRIDHMFGNLGMLKKCLKYGIKAYIKDDNNSIELIDRPIIIRGNKGEFFSIYAYCDLVDKLSISGAKYKLDNYNLELGDSRTVSNEFLSGYVKISFKKGMILLFRSKD